MDAYIRLKDLRLSKGLSQKQLAENSGIHYRTIQNYEHGKQEPMITIMVALSDYFNVSLDYLCGRTDNPLINK